MKFIDIGEGAIVDGLRLNKNVIIADDLSKVETFVSVGKNGRVINLDAEGNEVHTPESYYEKLSYERADLFTKFKECELEISSIKNQVMQSKIKSKIQEIQALPIDSNNEFDFKRKLIELKDLSKLVGIGVITNLISGYLGY